MEKPGDDARHVQVHPCERVGDLEGMDEIGLARKPVWPLWAFAEKIYAFSTIGISALGLYFSISSTMSLSLIIIYSITEMS